MFSVVGAVRALAAAAASAAGRAAALFMTSDHTAGRQAQNGQDDGAHDKSLPGETLLSKDLSQARRASTARSRRASPWQPLRKSR